MKEARRVKMMTKKRFSYLPNISFVLFLTCLYESFSIHLENGVLLKMCTLSFFSILQLLDDVVFIT